MANIFASPVENLLAGVAGPLSLGNPAFLGGVIHALVKTVNLATTPVTTADEIVWGKLPKGALPITYGFLASATMGASATLTLGIAGALSKYRDAATFTTANQLVLFGKAGACGVQTTAEEVLRSAIAAANLPGAGTLTLIALYTLPEGG